MGRRVSAPPEGIAEGSHDRRLVSANSRAPRRPRADRLCDTCPSGAVACSDCAPPDLGCSGQHLGPANFCLGKPPECRTAISRIESRVPRGSSLFGSGFRLARGYCRRQLLANAAIAASRGPLAKGGAGGIAHHVRQGLLRPTWRAPALWRRGEVQLDRLAAGTRARLGGELSGAGLKNLHRDLLGAVDADPGAEHPAARAVATRLVRCQSEALAHHASVANATRAGSGASAQSTGIRLLVAPDRVRQDARRR